jgi:hypothetical protein
MKDFLSRVIHGFALGLGMAAALAVGIYVAKFISDHSRAQLSNNDASKVSVTFVRDATTSMGRAVVGTVLNSGSS